MDASDAGDTTTNNGEDVNSDAPCVPQSKGGGGGGGGVCMLRDGDDSLSTLEDDEGGDANAIYARGEDVDGKHHGSSFVQLEFDTTAESAINAASFWDPDTDLTKQVQRALFHSNDRSDDHTHRVFANPSAALADAEAERLYHIVESMVELHATPVQAQLWHHASTEQRHAYIVALPSS